MDAAIKKLMPQSAYMERPTTNRPTEAEVEAAVHTLLRWTGDDPSREGLVDTPKRVVKAYREMFNGYDLNPAEELGRTFEEVAGYDDLVIVKDISSIRIASTTWCRSSARRMSATCRTARSSACPRSRAASTSAPIACRHRRR